MQRTLNRELKELEIAGREANVTCDERRPGRGLSNGANHLIRDTPVTRGLSGGPFTVCATLSIKKVCPAGIS